MKSEENQDALRKAALDYHEFPTPGKLSVVATKQLLNQSDLALAYSPGVAAACEAIAHDPLNVFRYTARGDLDGVSATAPRCSAWARSFRRPRNRDGRQGGVVQEVRGHRCVRH